MVRMVAFNILIIATIATSAATASESATFDPRQITLRTGNGLTSPACAIFFQKLKIAEGKSFPDCEVASRAIAEAIAMGSYIVVDSRRTEPFMPRGWLNVRTSKNSRANDEEMRSGDLSAKVVSFDPRQIYVKAGNGVTSPACTIYFERFKIAEGERFPECDAARRAIADAITTNKYVVVESRKSEPFTPSGWLDVHPVDRHPAPQRERIDDASPNGTYSHER